MPGAVQDLLVRIHAIDNVTPQLKKIQGTTATFGGKMKAAGLMAAGAFAAVTAASVSMAAEFDHTMREVWTLTDQSQGRFEDMKKEVMDLAEKVPKSTEDLASGLYQVVSAGFQGAEAMDVLEIAAMGAVGGLTDTRTSVDAVTTALNAYGAGAEEAEAYLDSMFQAVKLGKITFEEIASGMSKATSVAAELGVKFDEVMAITAALTKAGVQSDTAFMSQRAMMISMLKPSEQLGQAMQQLGYSNAQTMLESMGLTDALNKLWEMSGQNVDKFAEFIPESRALSSALILVGSGADNVQQAMEGMKNKSGSAREAAEKMGDSLKNKLIVMWNKLKNGLLEFGNAVMPIVQGALEVIQPILSTVSKLFKFLGDNMKTVKIVAIAAAGAFLGFKILGKVVGWLQSLSRFAIAATARLMSLSQTSTTTAGTLAGAGISGIAGAAGIAVGALGALAVAVWQGVSAGQAQLEAWRNSVNEASNLIDQYRNTETAMSELEEGTDEYNAKAEEHKRAMAGIKEQVGGLFAQYSATGEIIGYNIDQLEKYNRMIDANSSETKAMAGNQDSADKMMLENLGTLKQNQKELDNTTKKMESYNEILGSGLAEVHPAFSAGMQGIANEADARSEDVRIAFEIMGEGVEGFKERIKEAGLPGVLQEDMDAMTTLIKDTDPQIRKLGLQMFEGLTQVAKEASPEFAREMQSLLDQASEKLRSEQPEVRAEGLELMEQLIGVISEKSPEFIRDIGTTMSDVEGTIGSTDTHDDMKQAMSGAETAMVESTEAMKRTIATMMFIIQNLIRTIHGLTEAANEARGHNPMMTGLLGTGEAMDIVSEAAAALNNALSQQALELKWIERTKAIEKIRELWGENTAAETAAWAWFDALETVNQELYAQEQALNDVNAVIEGYQDKLAGVTTQTNEMFYYERELERLRLKQMKAEAKGWGGVSKRLQDQIDKYQTRLDIMKQEQKLKAMPIERKIYIEEIKAGRERGKLTGLQSRYKGIIDPITALLQFLQSMQPPKQSGGFIKRTAPAMLHEGEFVLPASVVASIQKKQTRYTPVKGGDGATYNINLSAGAFLGTPGEARRYAKTISKYIKQEEGR